MLRLFFGNLFSALTTVLVLGMLAFVVVSIIKRHRIEKWGRRILAFILIGTAISAFAAMRDAFMMENALFCAVGMQSAVCSILGGFIFLTGIVALIVKNQRFRKTGFILISLFFLIQVITIEASRIAISLGDTL